MNYILKNKRYIYLHIAILIYLFWNIILPFNGGPDEPMRTEVIKGILLKNRIPIAGDNDIFYGVWGINYAFLISNLPYMLGALLAKFFGGLNLPIYYYGRAISLLAGIISFIYFDRLIRRFCKIDKSISYWFSGVLIFWPQIGFMWTYTNTDSISIMLTILIIYYTLKALEDGWKLETFIKISIFSALQIITYYNGYSILVGIIIIFLWDNIKNFKFMLKRIGIGIVIVGVIAGPYLMRNVILYSDMFGMSLMKELGNLIAIKSLKPMYRQTYSYLEFPLSKLLFNKNWYQSAFCSYYGTFGPMSIVYPIKIYYIYFYIMCIGFICFIKSLFNLNSKEKKVYVGLTIGIMTNITLFIIYNYATDYQSQGRYLLPTAPALILLAIYSINKIKNGIYLIKGICIFNLINVFWGIQLQLKYFKINLIDILNVEKLKFLIMFFIIMTLVIISLKFNIIKKIILSFLLVIFIYFSYFLNFKNLEIGSEISELQAVNVLNQIKILEKKESENYLYLNIETMTIDKELFLIIDGKKYRDLVLERIQNGNKLKLKFIVPLNEIKGNKELNFGWYEEDKLFLNKIVKKEKKQIKIVDNLPILKNIDGIREGTKSVFINGWIFIDRLDVENTITELIVQKGENEIIHQKISQFRPDVTLHFNNGYNLDDSGFLFKIDKESLNNSKIYLRMIDKKKKNGQKIKLNLGKKDFR